MAKYTQHQRLAELLLSTGNRVLLEHTENDHYWGDGKDGTGLNVLGKMLMSLRGQLRADEGRNPLSYTWRK